jgi:hypothetical protein
MFNNTCADFAAHWDDLSAFRMRCSDVKRVLRAKTSLPQRARMLCRTWQKFAALTAFFSPCYHIYIRNRSPLIYLQLQLAVIIKVFLRYIKLCGVVREVVTVADVR